MLRAAAGASLPLLPQTGSPRIGASRHASRAAARVTEVCVKPVQEQAGAEESCVLSWGASRFCRMCCMLIQMMGRLGEQQWYAGLE